MAASVGAPEASYINQKGFLIPLRIEESRRAEIRQVHLYASTREDSGWQPAGTITPDKEGFPFNAPGDGVYFFKVQVEGIDGAKEPADILKAPVSQKIIVDTQRPQLQIVDAERQGDNLVVRWDGREENPDLNTLKLEFRISDSAEGVWMPVTLTNPTLRGQATFKPGSSGAVSLRMQLQDLAQNAAIPATLELPAAPGGIGTNIGGHAIAPSGSGLTGTKTQANPDAGNEWSATRGTVQVQPVSSRNNPKLDGADTLHPAPRSKPDPVDDLPPHGGGIGSIPPLTGSGGAGSQLVASSNTPAPGKREADPMPSRPARGAMPRLQIINTRKVTLDYEAKLGPSGLGSVELYLTRDDGQKWERLSLDPASVSPIAGDATTTLTPVRRSLTVELPGEGRFGFFLVVKSGAGLGKPGPREGDAPQMLVEVDETAPEANLYAPEPDPKQHDSLILRWSASDPNLATKPISLEWAERPTGPWNKIGGGDLPNTPSQYTWKLTSDVPPKVYLRLLVRDTAGNVAKAETAQPILVDLYEPEAQFIGLSGSGKQ
jgi:hypothetical protein